MTPPGLSNKGNLSSEVFAVLKKRIIHWEYPPGYRFTEEQLCAEFKVSRSPIREALRMLVENGLVDKIPHYGYSVKQPNSVEIHELYDVRLALESFIVERVAERGLSPEEAQTLRQPWEIRLSGLPQVDVDVAHEDERFHEALAQLTGNKALLDLLRSINERLRFVRMTDITTPERLQITCQQHLVILDRLIARDAVGARQAMKRNVEQGRDHVEVAFKEALARAYHDQSSPQRPSKLTVPIQSTGGPDEQNAV